MFSWKKYRRNRLRTRPFPAAWQTFLETGVPLFRRLPPHDRQELLGHVRIFLAEKHFEGGGGFIVTDEVRLTIAAQACALLMHRASDYYPSLVSIVIYPGEFLAPVREIDEWGVVTEGIDQRSGESWQDGTLIFSWEDIARRDLDVHAGYNVVLHECAHQLDAEEGITTDPCHSPMPLARILIREFQRHMRDTAHRRTTVIDPYGAESLPEFFAVATESFFEQPVALRDRHRELYDALADYYRLDPASWKPDGKE